MVTRLAGTVGFNTQPPEGGCDVANRFDDICKNVSTHSHPKVAASLSSLLTASYASFNTQPPEGGCLYPI